METSLAEVVLGKWQLAFAAWVTYNVVIGWIEKEKADRAKQEFGFWIFFKTHVDNWVVTAIACWWVIMLGPEIHYFIMKFVPENYQFPWYHAFYAGPPVLVELLYFFITEILPIMKKYFLQWIEERFKTKLKVNSNGEEQS